MPLIHRTWRSHGLWRLVVGVLVALAVSPARLVAQTAVQSAGDAAVPVTAFVGVNVVPMDRERILTGQTVLVRGDHIVALGPTAKVPVPAGATHVDGSGKFLLPGLADMHAHVYATISLPADDSDATKAMFFYVANGITTIRIMNGSPQAVQLRGRTARGEVIGPRIYSTTPAIYQQYPPVDAVKVVERARADGYDFVKMYNSGEAWDSTVAAARRSGLRMVGHVPRPPDRGLSRALAVPYASIEHLTGYVEDVLGLAGRWDIDSLGDTPDLRTVVDTAVWIRPGFTLDPQRIQSIVAATRRAETWNCPTLSVYDSYTRLGQPVTPEVYAQLYPAASPDDAAMVADSAALPPRVRVLATVAGRWLTFQMRLTKALQEGGAGLLLGTDEAFWQGVRYTYGFGIHRELALLVQAGLTPYQALATGTRNVAAFLGTLDSTGTVAVGKRADLVLVNGNPLDDIANSANLAGTMVGGRWVSRAAVDAQLDAWKTYQTETGALDLSGLRRQLWMPRPH